jgi:hypothetical protein
VAGLAALSESTTHPKPAIKELLVFTHGGMVKSRLAAHQLKVFPELVMKFLIVVTNHVQPAAL